MASRAKCVGVLVLSGEATLQDLENIGADDDEMPDIIVESVADLL